jgi:predicted PurR-regulated permease PerM
MLVVGLLSYIGLVILDVDYPLALGIISGLFEVVPMIGPIMSAIVASFVALSISPASSFGVIVLFIVIQQFENNLLVPKIMQKVSGFSPIVIILALMIGGQLFGILGAILAAPSAMVLAVLIKRYLNYSDSE